MPCYGQLSNYVVKQFNNTDGLSSSYVNRIFQDSDELLWFATWDGLNVYDGSAFHVFNYNRQGMGNTLGSNVIYQLTEDRLHHIWLGTAEGVSKYEKSTGRISNYLYDLPHSAVNGYFLALDSVGTIYAARINSASVSYYDTATDKFYPCSVSGLSGMGVRKMAFDRQGRLWIFTNEGLQVYHKEGHHFYAIKAFPFARHVDNLLFTNGHIFYTTTQQELIRVDDDLHIQTVLSLQHPVRSMTFYQDHYLLAWNTKGIGAYGLDFKPDDFLLNEVPLLKNTRINNLFTGVEKMLWCGTDGGGIVKIAKRENYFTTVSRGGKPLINAPVRAFCNVNGRVWAAAKGNGIITLPEGNGLPIFTPEEAADYNIYAMASGHDGLVYIGSDGMGLSVYDPFMRKTWHWKTMAGTSGMALPGAVRTILCAADSSIWMGLSAGGLVHLKLMREGNELHITQWQRYPYNGGNTGPGNDVINALAQSADGLLWIGCRFGGLSVLDPRSGKFTTFRAGAYAGSLSNNDVLSLYCDRQDRMWVGTSYGLNWMYTKDIHQANPRFNTLNIEDGLPNSTFHAIAEDAQGGIWVSTNNGLAQIDPQNGKTVQFRMADGLQSDEFCDNAIWKDDAGYLYFGNVAGFNYCLPAKMHFSHRQSNLLLTDLQLGGHAENENSIQVVNMKHALPAPHFSLPRRNNFLEFRVKTINFSNKQKSQYAYYLEKYDKVWHYLGPDRRIAYSNIPPGNYKMIIKWSNGEGTWNNGVTAFYLTVQQYFWLTWPAFLGYCCLLALGVYAVHIYRRNKLQMQHKLTMEHVLREKDEALHQEQLNFFTNIAHELQTPLTLITGSLELYQQPDSTPHFLSIVNQQASRLNYLVYQLLEFRKAEAGHLKNRYSYLNVSQLLTNIAALFTPLQERHNQQFLVDILPLPDCWMDKDKFEKIAFNLLSNAFKHTPSGCEIHCSLCAKDDCLELVVANAGNTLPQADIEKLFNKFFVTGNTEPTRVSTGLGLALTRQLVTLLNGHIQVACDHNWIYFTVTLPAKVVPAMEERLAGTVAPTEQPSHLLKTMTDAPPKPAPDNRQALLDGLGQEQKKSILVVEDDPDIRYLLNDLFKEDYIVFEAGNGREALDLMNTVVPNLIIADIMMPDMSGLELCNTLKHMAATCHIPFVMLSARSTIDHQTEGYEAGADAYIPKPFHTGHLQVRVRKLLEYQEKLHTLFRQDRVINHLSNTGMKEEDKAFLEQTIRCINQHIDNEALDAALLEKSLAMSKAYFYRRVKALSGMTPGELIKTIRLQHAAQLLQTTDMTVAEVFYSSGFSNQSHFFREFKKKYQTSPSEYRAGFVSR
ncbi:Signal transduction histidine kinase [Chitinophaga costaii]|uniref:histidine kinase n=1 Tax=Chitinophaga costaii TaxID=1335309 RepID=A0A1C4FUL6_9BACT|nr:hybrid sensor histidine kinase/response regulator transcription factor [Chitinophaga costaii]SCC59343.1 Signal transduction histidine kinase [Chitinophaga costaii]